MLKNKYQDVWIKLQKPFIFYSSSAYLAQIKSTNGSHVDEYEIMKTAIKCKKFANRFAAAIIGASAILVLGVIALVQFEGN